MQRTLLSTRLFTVERRAYERPDEGTVTRDVVVHPGAVVILPVLDDRRIVMIRNYRYTIEQELWELPAGTIEKGEDAFETAKRELEEETGYCAGRLRSLMTFYTSPGVMTERMHAYIATDLTPVGQRLQGGERIIAEAVDIGVVRDRYLRNEFSDGKTIAVLGRYLLGQIS